MSSRAVLVTGASRGIGAEIARALAVSGDRVAVHHGRECAPSVIRPRREDAGAA